MTRTREGSDAPSVCCIGLGLMGEPMARHLCEVGWAVTGYDIDASRMAACAPVGVRMAASPAEAAANVDFIVLNLPNGAATRSALWDSDGFGHVARPPQLVVDFSTIGPRLTIDFARHLEESGGCRWIDAPVSGGPLAAANGTLTAMIGGSDVDIERAAPLLDSVTAHRTTLGRCGSGQTMKLINQLIVGTNHLVMAEAARLAEGLDIDLSTVPDSLNGGHADSALLKILYPRMVTRDFEPVRGYALQLLKDLDLVNEAAEARGLSLPVMSAARAAYAAFVASGAGRRDTAAIIDYLDPVADMNKQS